MIIDFHNRGGGGGGTADYAISAGTSNSTKLLNGEANFPQSANTGDVVAIGSNPTRGLKSGAKAPVPSIETGVYQYDGSNWNKIEGGEGDNNTLIPSETLPSDPVEGQIANYSDGRDNIGVLYRYDGSDWQPLDEEFASYVIELSTSNPDDFDGNDVDNINGFLSEMDNGTIDIYNVVIGAAGYVYQLAYFDDNGTIGFAWQAAFAPRMQYIELHYEDGEYTGGSYSEWEPESVEATLLKSVSATPATVGQGDVFALTTPAQEGTWETFDGSAGATLVRILTKSDGTYLFHFNNDNLFTGLDYTGGTPAVFDGQGWGLTEDVAGSEWHYDNNGYYIKVWVEGEKDDWYIYAEMTAGEGGFSTLDAYGLGSGSEMFGGEEPAKVSVLQRYITPAEDIVEVTYPDCSDEGGGRWQGRKVYVSVSGIPDEDYYLTQFESFDNFAQLHIDGERLYLHNSATDTDIFSIPLTGGMGSGLLGQVVIIGTYSQANERFEFQAYNDLAYNDQSAVVNGGIPSDLELAKKSDIPSPLPNPANKGGCALVSDNSGYTLTENPVVQSHDTASSLGAIANIVRIYQSDYNNLVSGSSVDSNTFYVIIQDPQV